MQIKTAFGDFAIDPETILTFPQGLPGFETEQRYTLLYEETSQSPVVYKLQSVDQPDISFSVTDPGQMNISYEFVLGDDEIAILGGGEPEDVIVLLLLYRNSVPPVQATDSNVNAALRSPIVINFKTRKGLQKILTQAELSVHVQESAAS